MKKLIKGIVVAVTLAVMSACAANNVTNSQNDDTQGFGVLNNTAAGGAEQFGGMGNFKGFMKDLNLTADQKAQFKALKTDAQNHFKGQKDSRQAFMKTLKESFLSATMDKASLKAKIEALKPNEDEQLSYMAANIIKAYNILTPAQRTSVETKINDMEAKMSQFTGSQKFKDSGKMKDKKFDWFTKDLNLNDAQKASLKALMDGAMPGDRTEMINKAKTVKNDVLAELKKASPSADNIKAILKANKPDFESKIDGKLDKLVSVHDILTADQRQKIADRLEKMHSGFGKRGHRGHKKA